jgi:hypothetical protein
MLHKRSIVILITLLVVLGLGCLAFIRQRARQTQDHQAAILLAEFKKTRSTSTAKELVNILDNSKVSIILGNQILAELVKPTISTRKVYPAGVRPRIKLNNKTLISISKALIANRNIQCETFVNMDLNCDTFQSNEDGSLIENFRDSTYNPIHKENFFYSIAEVKQLGAFKTKIIQKYSLIPLRIRNFYFDDTLPFPIPRFGTIIESSNTWTPRYTATLEIPIEFAVVNPSEAEQVDLIKTDSVTNEKMQKAFVVKSSSGTAWCNGIRFDHLPVLAGQNPPLNVAFDAFFKPEEDNAKEIKLTYNHISRPILLKSGESEEFSIPFMNIDRNLIQPNKRYKGTLILRPSKEVAQTDSDFSNIWGGELTFPIEFTTKAIK